MADRKSENQAPAMNCTYISPRLLTCLNEAEHCRVTSVVAPMGYGKSTAVRWWTERYTEKHPEAVVLFQTLSGDGEDTFWRGFCRVLRKYPELARQMMALGYPGDRERIHLLVELLEDALGEDGPPVVYILDDMHYFSTPDLAELFATLALHLPARMRIILISRNRIFREADRFRLGGNLCQITMSELRLQREEIRAYASLCGLSMDAAQAEELDRISEGWVSLLYLLFRSYFQQGRWNLRSPDIFRLMDQVMYEPLDARKQRFLFVNGLTESFSRKQAAYLWREPALFPMTGKAVRIGITICCGM